MKKKNVSITHAKRRYIAVGCSHGNLASEPALEAVLKFKAEYKPEIVIHLGDFMDFTALRSGSANTPDEGANIADDIEAGMNFLNRLQPTLVFNGNHEIRPWKIAQSNRAREADHAARIVADMRALMAKLKARYVEAWDWHDGFVELGGTLFGHGHIYNENAAREHAETLCQDVVFAHWHRLVQQSARVRNGKCPNGYCVGTLADIPKLAYASGRRSTTAWRNGFIYGEIWNDRCTKTLYDLSHETEIKQKPYRKYDSKWAGIGKRA